MGRRRARFNERARSSSHTTKYALPHPSARDKSAEAPERTKAAAHLASADAAHPQPASEAIQIDSALQSSDGYVATDSANPLILPASKSTESGTAHGTLAALPEAPTGKMTSKKRKRLEKYIEKHLKKEERAKLLEKLRNQTFSSSLLKSSANIGNMKLTARQQLRMALDAERAGITLDPTEYGSRLYVEHEIAESDEQSSNMTTGPKRAKTDQTTDSESDGDQDSDAEMALDFTPRPDNSERGVQVVEAQGYAGSAPKDLLVKTDAALKPAFGGALKRPLVFKPLPTTQRSKAVSQKPGVKRTALNGADSGSDSDSDGHVEPNSSTVENGNKTATSHKGQGVTASNLSSLPVVPEQVAKAIRAASTLEKSYPAPSKSVKSSRPSFFVSIDRPEAVQIARVSLPVVGEEQAIMESIYENDVTILCGETGSGKTTQVPQFLYEAGFGDPKHPKFKGMIGITQPRRVAAVSMASRVGEEMSLTGGQVAYQIRYDSTTVKPSTRIKFMTDGVLLRELSGALGIHSEGSSASERGPSGDLLLKKYSCIIIDEAHERTVGTDVLIGWLTRIVSIRNSGKIKGVDPLKLVIMSATLRVEDFTENKGLFPGPSKPPVIKVDGRQYKVTVHYNKKTPELDYVSEAYKKVCKIHTKLPKGGVLVFLTGQREVMSLVTKLRDRFPQKDLRTDSALEGTKMSEKGEGSGNGMMDEVEEADLDATDLANDDFVYDSDDGSDNEESDLEVLPGEDGEDDADDAANDARDEKVEAPLHVLPLYSLLSTKAQMMVFEPPPEGARLVVVATNVAETSLTIPNMRYVVDCGKVKERRYDIHTGVQTFQIHWTSQASADQRAGRAGRVGPGHCYRLFSSAVFANYFEKFTKPEILRIPIEDVILQMKAMGIQNVVNFPFPTIPSRDQLKRSENLLTHLGILEVSGAVSRITELGKVASRFPVSPRYAKMIVVAAQQKDPAILGFVIAIVSGLSVGDPFVMDDEILKEIEDAADTDEGDEKSRKSSKRAEWFRARHMFEGAAPTSDILRLLAAFGAYSCEARKSQHAAHQFCQDYFLRPKAMEEMLKLQSQLRNIVKDTLTEAELYPAAIAMERLGKLTPPTAKQGVLVRQILLVAFPDHVARLDESYRGPKDASPVYQTMWAEKDEIFVIHPSSCLHNERPAPKWIVYGEIVGKEERVSADTSGLVGVRGALSMDGTKVGNDGSLVAQFGAVPSGSRKKIWIKSVTSVAENWIAGMMPASLCSTGRILDDPEPRYNPKKDSIAGFAIPTLGPKLWMLPTREIDLPEGMLKYAYFAKALLEGVLDFERNSRDCFKILEPFLTSRPATITKSWSKSSGKVRQLLETLAGSKVVSKATLIRKWKTTPKFMLDSFLLWTPADAHNLLRSEWPPVRFVGDTCKVNQVLGTKLGSLLAGGLSRAGGTTTATTNPGSDYDSDY